VALACARALILLSFSFAKTSARTGKTGPEPHPKESRSFRAALKSIAAHTRARVIRFAMLIKIKSGHREQKAQQSPNSEPGDLS